MPLVRTPPRPLPGAVRAVLGNRLFEGITTPHGVSRYLEQLHPLWTLEGGRAAVTEVQHETADVTTYTLQPDHVWNGALPGQHVRLGITIDGVVRTRTYSVSSSAHRDDGCFTVSVKRKPGGLVSEHLHEHLRPGSIVECSAATGDVVLPETRPERLLLISAGSGITPLAGMLRTLADEGHTGEVTFLHYARTRDDVPFLTELEAIADRLAGVRLVIVTTAAGTSPSLRGRFRPEHLDTVLPDHLGVATFACGPTGLVDAVESHLEASGAADQLQVERFTPPALVRPEGVAGGAVTFATTGATVIDDGRTLLEQAEAAGLEPVHGCRMGICRSCTRRKPAGAVTDLRSGRISDEPDEDVQICVSVPAGDVVVDL